MKKQIVVATITAALVSAGCLLLVQPAGAAGSANVEVAFSPDGGAERLVLRTIDGAQRSIRVMAYDFTSPTVVRALIAAKKRGVDVAVTVDYRSNIEEDRSGRAHAALGTLTYAGIPVRTVSAYSLQHSNRNPQGCYMAVRACFPESTKVADEFVLWQGGELA